MWTTQPQLFCTVSIDRPGFIFGQNSNNYAVTVIPLGIRHVQNDIGEEEVILFETRVTS